MSKSQCQINAKFPNAQILFNWGFRFDLNFGFRHLKLSRRIKGFTLVELVVTTGIIIMLSAFMLPSFNGMASREKVENEAIRLSQAIIQARSYAKAPRSEKTGNVSYYAVEINKDDNSFLIKEGNIATSAILDSGKISSDIIIEFPEANPLLISFPITSRGIPDSSPSITVKSDKTDREQYIEINQETGNVKICDDHGC